MTDSSSPVVCSFESRRAEDMRRLIERHDCQPIVAPSMRELPLEDNAEAVKSLEQVIDSAADVFVFLTGVGAEAMFRLAETAGLAVALGQLLENAQIVARGPKPAAILRQAGFSSFLKADEPNTWREVLQVMDDNQIQLDKKSVAVQEYGAASNELYEALKTRGARVLPIAVYRWALPEDCGPLRDAIRQVIDSRVDVLLFTSAQQIRNIKSVAEENRMLAGICDCCTNGIRSLNRSHLF